MGREFYEKKNRGRWVGTRQVSEGAMRMWGGRREGGGMLMSREPQNFFWPGMSKALHRERSPEEVRFGGDCTFLRTRPKGSIISSVSGKMTEFRSAKCGWHFLTLKFG